MVFTGDNAVDRLKHIRTWIVDAKFDDSSFALRISQDSISSSYKKQTLLLKHAQLSRG